MKTLLKAVLLIILLSVSCRSFSQTVYFSSSTNPVIHPGSLTGEFSCYNEYGCYLFCHVSSLNPINTEQVAFDIFKFNNSTGKYNYVKTEYRYSKYYSYKYSIVAALSFLTGGDYLVKVFDGDNDHIGNGYVRMNLK